MLTCNDQHQDCAACNDRCDFYHYQPACFLNADGDEPKWSDAYVQFRNRHMHVANKTLPVA
jgi:hypothetical protein